ncbi:Rha family transcriptional regulator [Bacteroides sp. BFG-606]|uniref:Rha family transcriptional regulator n=1 Tax=Bacteroides sp. BFG-606 TaxID=2972763 RepID=UPI002165E9FE|nr:Rha family transcriptional regulator [Bacteroides sp. BFG-606]MCS2336773.1 Rha family transcriptional regulator [Bacteroides sp. BFG-606]
MKDLSIIKETMSSIEIAELTGKPHNDVLKAIRAMEPAWEKVAEGKFSLSEYKDSTGRKLPMYELNKIECLYIATKFNDEARAKLVLRWEQLEKEKLQEQQRPMSSAEIILQMAQLGVEHEKRIAKVELDFNKIIEEREQAEFDLDYVPVSEEILPGMSLRKKILAIVNAYQKATQMAHRTLWDNIYKKLYYNYGVALTRCKKIRKSETWLEVAERKGHLEKIYTIVSEYAKSK